MCRCATVPIFCRELSARVLLRCVVVVIVVLPRGTIECAAVLPSVRQCVAPATVWLCCLAVLLLLCCALPLLVVR